MKELGLAGLTDCLAEVSMEPLDRLFVWLSLGLPICDVELFAYLQIKV